jgi:hypothetical protein
MDICIYVYVTYKMHTFMCRSIITQNKHGYSVYVDIYKTHAFMHSDGLRNMDAGHGQGHGHGHGHGHGQGHSGLMAGSFTWSTKFCITCSSVFATAGLHVQDVHVFAGFKCGTICTLFKRIFWNIPHACKCFRKQVDALWKSKDELW